MGDEVRKSGLAVIGDIPWGSHFCQFYQTKKDLIDTLVPYFKTGLENNEFCMWVTADNLTEQEARRAMSKAVPNFSGYLKKGQIEILPYDEWYLKEGIFNNQRVLDGWVEKLEQALKKGYDGLRLTGNTFWLEKEQWQSFTDYEEAVNNVIGKYKMVALCTYCLDKCNATEIVDVIRNHEFALIKQEGKWELFENSRYKTTKEALVASETRFSQLYHSMTEGLALHEVIYDTTGEAVDYIIQDVNPAYEQITGLKADKAIGKKASELYGTSEPPYLNIYAKVANTCEPTSFETYFPPMAKHFNISVFSPRKGSFATVFSDVTERKKNEQKLLEQAAMLVNAGDAIIGYDGDFHVTSWNLGAEKIYGYNVTEAIGQVSNVLLKPTYFSVTREELVNRIMTDGHLEATSSRQTKDGRTVDVETHVIALRNDKGQTTGYVAVDRDITERKKMETELAHRASFPELNPNPIIELDADYKIIYLNPAIKKLFPDISYQGIKHPFLADWKEIAEKLKNGKTPFINREVKAGESWYVQTITYIPSSNSYRLYGRDITERKKMEEILRENQGDLNRAQSVANTGSWRLDIRRDELIWSEETYRIFGIPAGTPMTYEKFLSTIHPGDRESVNQKWTAALNGEPYDIEHRILLGNEMKWVREKADLELDPSGKLIGGFGAVQDITERKQAEENLLREKIFSETTINSLPGVFYLFKEDGKFLRWNRNFEIVTGYSPKEFAELSPLDLFNPEEKKVIADAIRRVFTEGKVEVEANIIAKNGKKVPYYFTGIRMLDNGVPYLIGSGIDISERKQAENMLRETSNYLNNLFIYANAPIIVWDTHFTITRFNPAFEKLTGYKAANVLGKQLDILFPEDRQIDSLIEINRTLSGRRWEVVELPILRVDGTIRYVLWNSANVYDNEGKTIIATIAQGQDITERKQTEERLRETSDYLNNLLDYANAPIIVWDPQYRITRFNHAFERLTGISARDAIGKPLDILFPEDSKVESLEHIRSTQSGEHWEVVEIPILRKDGTVSIVLWNSATLFDVDVKKIVATIAQGQDITERKQAEEEVRKLNEELRRHATELEASNKELEAFAYSVSHDLRAPLRSIEGFSQALLEDCFDLINDEGKDYLRRIQGSAELMAQLIDDMLQLSRLTRDNMQLEDINLSEIAQKIISDLKKSAPERKTEFVISPELRARCDEKLIYIALYNLLDNAWKFTSKSATTRIEFGMTERNGKTAYYVRDNGAGFDMTYVDKLFKPFQRLHSSSEFPGTGIGLASVQRIINRHGGQVWAEGKVGEGATFYFTLG